MIQKTEIPSADLMHGPHHYERKTPARKDIHDGKAISILSNIRWPSPRKAVCRAAMVAAACCVAVCALYFYEFGINQLVSLLMR